MLDIKFDAKRAKKWINRLHFDHFSENEYLAKQKELDILPKKFKFALNDLILLFKIISKYSIILYTIQ